MPARLWRPPQQPVPQAFQSTSPPQVANRVLPRESTCWLSTSRIRCELPSCFVPARCCPSATISSTQRHPWLQCVIANVTGVWCALQKITKIINSTNEDNASSKAQGGGGKLSVVPFPPACVSVQCQNLRGIRKECSAYTYAGTMLPLNGLPLPRHILRRVLCARPRYVALFLLCGLNHHLHGRAPSAVEGTPEGGCPQVQEEQDRRGSKAGREEPFHTVALLTDASPCSSSMKHGVRSSATQPAHYLLRRMTFHFLISLW